MYTRVLSLILSRLVIVITLLGLGIIVNASYNPNLDLKPLLIFAASVCLLSVGYFVALRLSEHYDVQLYIQVFIDVMLTTWLIYLMRASDFSLAPLYLVIVLGASMVLPRPGVLSIGIGCVLSYSILVALFYFKVLVDDGRFLQSTQQNNLPLYALALLLLTILGGQLAERLRRSDSDLEIATRYLADLRAFNERIVQSINSGLVTTDLTGTVLSFNRAAEEITRYQAARVRGRHFYDVFGDLSAFSLFDQSEMQPTRRLPRFDVDCIAHDGRTVHLGFSASPLISEASTVTGYVFSFQDLTEVIKLEQEIRRRDRLAALGKMAAGIAHEIRNPLAAMRGSIQLLRSEMEITEDQEYLFQIILRESDRLNRIITDFLAYARPSHPHMSRVDLVPVIEETVTLLRNSPEVHPDHQITVQIKTRPLILLADAGQIRQVMWNLSRNSLQAMPHGGTLDIFMESSFGKEIEIKLRDNGLGMSQEQMDRLFEPFNSSRTGGTGLGMAIVYQIITDHQGTISVTSGPQTSEKNRSGTEITIRLPIRETLPSVTGKTGAYEKLDDLD